MNKTFHPQSPCHHTQIPPETFTSVIKTQFMKFYTENANMSLLILFFLVAEHEKSEQISCWEKRVACAVVGELKLKPNVLFMQKVFMIIISPENANKEPNANIAQSSMVISEINMFMTHNATRIIKAEAFATMLE